MTTVNAAPKKIGSSALSRNQYLDAKTARTNTAIVTTAFARNCFIVVVSSRLHVIRTPSTAAIKAARARKNTVIGHNVSHITMRGVTIAQDKKREKRPIPIQTWEARVTS